MFRQCLYISILLIYHTTSEPKIRRIHPTTTDDDTALVDVFDEIRRDFEKTKLNEDLWDFWNWITIEQPKKQSNAKRHKARESSNEKMKTMTTIVDQQKIEDDGWGENAFFAPDVFGTIQPSSTLAISNYQAQQALKVEKERQQNEYEEWRKKQQNQSKHTESNLENWIKLSKHQEQKSDNDNDSKEKAFSHRTSTRNKDNSADMNQLRYRISHNNSRPVLPGARFPPQNFTGAVGELHMSDNDIELYFVALHFEKYYETFLMIENRIYDLVDRSQQRRLHSITQQFTNDDDVLLLHLLQQKDYDSLYQYFKSNIFDQSQQTTHLDTFVRLFGRPIETESTDKNHCFEVQMAIIAIIVILW